MRRFIIDAWPYVVAGFFVSWLSDGVIQFVAAIIGIGIFGAEMELRGEQAERDRTYSEWDRTRRQVWRERGQW